MTKKACKNCEWYGPKAKHAGGPVCLWMPTYTPIRDDYWCAQFKPKGHSEAGLDARNELNKVYQQGWHDAKQDHIAELDKKVQTTENKGISND